MLPPGAGKRPTTRRTRGSSALRLRRRGRGRPLGTSGIQPSESRVSVIIPVANERRTIADVIRQCRKVARQTEIIVVANGTTDGSDRLAERLGANVIRFGEPLGHDVGRSIGAMHATGDILLFTDGDLVIPAHQLLPFVRAVEAGADLALNDYSGPTATAEVHNVVLAKHALNIMLGRPDLQGASPTAVPHALSRRALSILGAETLSVPPVALAMAITHGLNVIRSAPVNVRLLNPVRRKSRRKAPDPLEQVVFGDHLEAIDWLHRHAGLRGGFGEDGRNRGKAGWKTSETKR